MFSQSEHMYTITIILSNSSDDICLEIMSEDFCEPTQEDIQDIATTKHLVYFLTELFGEDVYEYIDQDILDELEEMELSDITGIKINDTLSDTVYYINLTQKTVDVEK